MSGNKVYQGPYAEHLRAFIEEKRLLGCRYLEEERLSFTFDQLSLKFDCSEGLCADLAHAFTEYQPNWQATTQKRVSARIFFRVLTLNQRLPYLTISKSV